MINKTKFIKNFIVTVFLLLTSFLPLRSILKNQLIGDPYDTRLQIVLYEHWNWVLKGGRSFTDTFFFYPYKNALGFSDAFFAPGIIHTFFRFLKFDIVDAWLIANFFTIVFATIGLYFLISEFTKNILLRFIFVYLAVNSYQFISFFYIWPNVSGYLLISWVLYFSIKIYKKEKITKYLNLISIYLPILALSFWYPAFFSLGYLSFFITFIVLTSKNKKSQIKEIFIYLKNYFRDIKNLMVTLISIFFCSIFGYIYFQESPNLKRIDYEIIRGTLSLNDIFSTKFMDGSFFQPIYYLLKLDKNNTNINEWSTNDWAIGFSPLMILIVLILVFILRKKLDVLDKFLFSFISLYFILFLRINENGIYVFIWKNFDFIKSIRTPVRFNIIIVIIILLLLFKLMFKLFELKNHKINVLIILILALISIDNYRPVVGIWNKSQLINKSYLPYVNDIKKNCKYFSIINPGAGYWSDNIESMVLSSLTNVPTINGYSGSAPRNIIQVDYKDPNNYEAAIEYINLMGLGNDGCFIDLTGVKRLDSLNTINFFNFKSPFIWESNSEANWTWITQPQIDFTITNFSNENILDLNKVYFEAAPCKDRDIVLLTQSDKLERNVILNNKKSYIFDNYIIGKNESIEFKVEANYSGCKVENDSRNLIYRIVIPKN